MIIGWNADPLQQLIWEVVRSYHSGAKRRALHDAGRGTETDGPVCFQCGLLLASHGPVDLVLVSECLSLCPNALWKSWFAYEAQ